MDSIAYKIYYTVGTDTDQKYIIVNRGELAEGLEKVKSKFNYKGFDVLLNGVVQHQDNYYQTGRPKKNK